jgi:hypothetical protein
LGFVDFPTAIERDDVGREDTCQGAFARHGMNQSRRDSNWGSRVSELGGGRLFAERICANMARPATSDILDSVSPTFFPVSPDFLKATSRWLGITVKLRRSRHIGYRVGCRC